MPHFQLGRKRLQSVVYPAAEQRRFHRAAPCFPAFLGPLPQHLVRRSQLAFFEDPPVGPFHAVADAFLVDIESDIVVDVHWVLLFEVSEPAVQSRSRHCTLQENPSSSQALYIQTGLLRFDETSGRGVEMGGVLARPNVGSGFSLPSAS